MEGPLSVKSGHPVFQHSGEETFPVIRPLSELPKRLTLEETLLKPNKALAPPDTAVLAEISAFFLADMKSSSIACLLRSSPASIILLCIRNAGVIPSEELIPHYRMLYPESQIAIKSGLVRNIKAGRVSSLIPVIYVACPAAIEFLGPSQRNLELAEDWKRMVAFGDAATGDSKFVTASLWYKAALEHVSGSEEIARIHGDLGGCMLSLQRFEEAIVSSSESIRADPVYATAFYCRAMAWYTMENHRAALTDFLKALELNSAGELDEEYLSSGLKRSRRLAEQYETGVYDVGKFFVGGCDLKDAPECAEFTSDAIEIRITSDGRGRGVFLTRDVNAGELLVVSNPLLVAGSLEDLQVFAIRDCDSFQFNRSRRVMKLLQDPESTKELPVPSIQDLRFDPTGSTYRWVEDDGGAIDVHSIRRAVEQASRLSFKNLFPEDDDSSKQLFVVPAFINHSCLPNSSVVAVGPALFIRAATSIPAGEEITISYIDCLQPVGIRSRMIRKAWDFTCSCRRCEVESRCKKLLEGVPGNSMITSVEAAVKRVEKLEIALAKMKSTMSEEERGMIQVGHIQAYLQVAGSMEMKICQEIARKFGLLSDIEAMKMLRRFVPGHGKGIALIARVVREYVLRLEWHPSFEVEFDDAIAAMIGKNLILPSEDYITLCDHLESDKLVSNLFGPASG